MVKNRIFLKKCPKKGLKDRLDAHWTTNFQKEIPSIKNLPPFKFAPKLGKNVSKRDSFGKVGEIDFFGVTLASFFGVLDKIFLTFGSRLASDLIGWFEKQ